MKDPSRKVDRIKLFGEVNHLNNEEMRDPNLDDDGSESDVNDLTNFYHSSQEENETGDNNEYWEEWDEERSASVHEDTMVSIGIADDDINLDGNWSEEKVDEVDEADYRLRCYVNFVCQEKLSNESIDRLDNLMTVLYGSSPIFTKTDVLRLIGHVEKSLIRKTHYYCNRCGCKKKEKREKCVKCRVSPKNLLETVTFIECNVFYQLERFLKKHASEIIQAHRNIRNGNELFLPNDIRRYEGYRSQMEVNEDFNKNSINLICSFSSDGAVFKRLSRREVTPVILSVEGVDITSKKNGRAFSLVALSFSDGGIKKNLIDEIVKKCFQQLNGLSIPIDIEGEIYTFRVVIMSVICDMKEQAALTSLPNWHNLQGCSRCLTVGRKKDRGKVTFDSYFSARRRTDKGMIEASSNQSEGFSRTEMPPIYNHVPPTAIDVDPFHVRGAGVCKTIVSEFLKPTRWKCGKIEHMKLDEIKKAIEGIVPYTQETVKTQSFKKISKYTGREWDKLSVIVSAVVGLSGSCEFNDFNALYIGWYYCLEFLGSTLAPMPSLRVLLYDVYKLHSQLEKDSITIKWHTFYEHLIEHEEKYGHLHTTEVFEREHKTLMTSVHHQTTNSEKILVARYSAGKIINESLQKSKSDMTADASIPIVGSILSRRELSADISKMTTNQMTFSELSDDHRILISELNLATTTIFLRRVQVVTVVGDFIFSAEKYWKTSLTTSSIITFIDPSTGVFKYGRIALIFIKSDIVYVLVKEFILEPLVLTLNAWSNDAISSTAKEIINHCLAFPSTLGKVVNEQYSLLPTASIVCPAILISLGDITYVKICLK